MPEILGQLVWPITVIVCVLILRQPLSALVKSTKRLKYKDLEVEFNEEIQRIEAEAANALPAREPSTGLSAEHSVTVDLYQLADVAPNASVVEVWRSVEQSAKKLIEAKGHSPDYNVPTPYKVIQDVLVRDGIIDSQSGKVFERLRRLRNKVVHAEGYELNSDQARDYVDLAVKLRSYFDYLADKAS